MNLGIKIVQAKSEDLKFCLSMDEMYFKKYIESADGKYNPDVWFKYLTKDLPRTFVLKENSSNIGYYRYSIMDDEQGQFIYLRVIALKEDYQKKGYGKLLYEHFENHVVNDLKVARIKLSCPKYLSSINWYPGIGYSEIEDSDLYKMYEKKIP